MTKRPDEYCDDCEDPAACNTADDCIIAKDGRKPLSEMTPQEVLDTVCPSGPLPPRPLPIEEDAA